LRVASLPDQVPYPVVAAAVPGSPGPLWTVIGIGGDDLAPVGVDLAAVGPGFVVCGPGGSGRSTALAAMARWSVERGTTVLAVAPRQSPLRAVPGMLGCYTTEQADDLATALDTVTGPLVVFADDAGELLDTDAEAVLLDVLRSAGERPWAVVVAGVTEELITTYRGITLAARRHKAGLVLSPTGPLDGELLGVRLPRGLPPKAGRGVLAVRGAATRVQVAC
jgi:S-DNA-T family DNA segregation ATPase FtsK/SpoIIIE